jgi:hypothetical protein
MPPVQIFPSTDWSCVVLVKYLPGFVGLSTWGPSFLAPRPPWLASLGPSYEDLLSWGASSPDPPWLTSLEPSYESFLAASPPDPSWLASQGPSYDFFPGGQPPHKAFSVSFLELRVLQPRFASHPLQSTERSEPGGLGVSPRKEGTNEDTCR